METGVQVGNDTCFEHSQPMWELPLTEDPFPRPLHGPFPSEVDMLDDPRVHTSVS